MKSQSVNKLVQEYQNIESILFTTDYSNFQNFTDLENFLQCADQSFTNKIENIQKKINVLHDQYVRASSVYEINNKKRSKEEELLQIERDKINNQLQKHKKRLQINVHPTTLVLKQKQTQITKLHQTKQIIQDFNKLIKGQQEDIKKLLPLDDNCFKQSALKIYIFKQLLQSLQNPEYDLAKSEIRKKYSQLKYKIFINFKQAYYKKDIFLIKASLPYCQQYDLMDQISDFYNQQVFKQSHKITKLSNQGNGESQIKNFFFLLQRGFCNAFDIKNSQTDEKSHYEIYQALGEYTDTISRRLISFVFDKLVKQSLQNVLKSTYNSGLYLSYLEIFYTECKQLLKRIQVQIQDERIMHLMSTYFQSIFDTYLESYLTKQTNFLAHIIEEQMSEITDEIKQSKISFRDNVQHETTKKFSIKKIIDFKIQEKKIDPQIIRVQIRTLNNVFTASSIEKIFMTIRQSLNRNMKISKINEVDRNRTQILSIFIKNLSQLMDILITAIAEVVPGFEDRSLALQPQFFQILPNINLILQRMQYLYIENKKQTKYQFAQALKLQQKKQSLITNCEKKLNKIIGDAMANILTIQNTILKSSEFEYFVTNQRQKMRHPSESLCSKVIVFLEKYLKIINKISLTSYRSSMLKSIGMQFLTLLISHYSRIRYNKQGLGMIFIDIANYKKVIMQMDYPQVDEKYKILRCLIDIYVIKNDQKTINGYVKTEKQNVLKNQKQETIRDYVDNKVANQIQS